MNKLVIAAIVAATSMCAAATSLRPTPQRITAVAAQAQAQPSQADSIATARRVESLKRQRADLQEQIRIADAKRNQKIEGVSADRLEQINLDQDSVCLQLRSQLTDVELELFELSPSTMIINTLPPIPQRNNRK